MAIVGLSERLYCDVRFLNDGVRMRSRWFFRCLIRFIRFVKPFSKCLRYCWNIFGFFTQRNQKWSLNKLEKMVSGLLHFSFLWRCFLLHWCKINFCCWINNVFFILIIKYTCIVSRKLRTHSIDHHSPVHI